MYSSQISCVGSHCIPGQSGLLIDLWRSRREAGQKGSLHTCSWALVYRVVTGDTDVLVSFWACESPLSMNDGFMDASGVVILKSTMINLSVLKYLL